MPTLAIKTPFQPGPWTRREELHDRAVTLEKGRLIGGTHFIVVDDDEFLSQACLGGEEGRDG